MNPKHSRDLLRSRALLLRRVEYRDSDLLLTLFTERFGKVAVAARGAKNSRKRFGGALEPIHTLNVEFSQNPGDRYLLQSASIEHARLQLTSDLERLTGAGRALGWVRSGAVEREPEPRVWELLTLLLDELDRPSTVHVGRALASAGIALLSAWGWGLELESCIHCGRPCPANRAAWVDAARGGLVCSPCGGARARLSSAQRVRLIAASRGDTNALLDDDAPLALELTDAALLAHADID